MNDEFTNCVGNSSRGTPCGVKRRAELATRLVVAAFGDTLVAGAG